MTKCDPCLFSWCLRVERLPLSGLACILYVLGKLKFTFLGLIFYIWISTWATVHPWAKTAIRNLFNYSWYHTFVYSIQVLEKHRWIWTNGLPVLWDTGPQLHALPEGLFTLNLLFHTLCFAPWSNQPIALLYMHWDQLEILFPHPPTHANIHRYSIFSVPAT